MDKMLMIIRKKTNKDNPCSGCIFENYYGCGSERDAINLLGLGDCTDIEGNYIYVKGEINFG